MAGDVAGFSSTGTSNYSKYQWQLKNTGLMANGNKGYDVGNTSNLKGNTTTPAIVAVMDTGVDYNNPSLAGQMYHFTADQQKALGCDEYGYCAAGYKGNDVRDISGHGTHCAGIIGADGTNGVSGVVSNKGVSIIAIKAMEDDTGSIWLSSEIRGWNWLVKAKESGVDVKAVNVSLGGTLGSKAENIAVDAADQVGITTIFASGNSSMDMDVNEGDTTMTSQGSTLNVNSMEASGKASPFSNYGLTSTELYAPGSSILSTVASEAATFNAFCAASDTLSGAKTRAVVYEGFESDNASDASDPHINGGLTFYYYDETQTNHLGDAVTIGKNYFYGEQGLDIPANDKQSATIISDQVDLSNAAALVEALQNNAQLYRGFSMWSERGRVDIQCDFKLRDGSFSNTTAENMGTFQWRNSGNSGGSLAAGQKYSDLQKLPENVDFENFQMKITLTFNDTSTILHLDSIGVGTDLDPYTVYGGTSMAAPATTGAFALLASHHPDEASSKIAARLVGGVEKQDTFADTCISGGRLNIDKANRNPDPVIQKATADGQMVKLEGWFLGNPNGATITIGGQEAKILTWISDSNGKIDMAEIVVPQGMTGKQMVVLTNGDGQSGRYVVMLSTDGSFTDLAVPSGNGYGSPEKVGLATADGEVYLLASNTSDDTTVLWRYDSAANNWIDLGKTSMNPKVSNGWYCQITGHQGKLYATSISASGTGDLWEYTPGTQVWRQIKTTQTLNQKSTPVSYNGQLLLIGGQTSSNQYSDAILEVNPDTGAVSTAGTLPEGVALAKTAVSGEKLALIGGDTASGSKVGLYLTDLKNTEKIDLPTYDEGQQMDLAIGGTAEGFIISGLVSTADGWQDTWSYNVETKTWSPAGATLSTAKTFGLAGLTVGDGFYVWGKSNLISGMTFFRKTTVSAPVNPVDPVDPVDPGTPGTPSTETLTAANTNTGITSPSNMGMIVAALCLVAAGVIITVVVIRKRK